MRRNTAKTPSKSYLVGEFVALFVALPSVLIVFRYEVAPRFLPILMGITAFSLWVLLRDPTFDRRTLFRAEGTLRHLPGMLVRLAIGGLVLSGLTAWQGPELFLRLPRESPTLWVAILLLYPIFSVIPQGIVFRVFLFHRYARLFPRDRVRIVVSALAFGFAHAFLGNWIAPVLATFGGLLFAARFVASRSGLVASLEHALWGDLLFSIGVGWWFYGGSIGQR